LHFSPNTKRVTTVRMTSENLKGRDHLGELGVDVVTEKWGTNWIQLA